MSDKYYRGVRVVEEGTDTAEPVSSSGLQVVIGTAPVNLAENPDAVVNVPVLWMIITE